MILHSSQNTVAADTTRFRVCCNGRRWGKTTLAVEEIKGKAVYSTSRIVYVAPTFQQARDIVWEHLKRELAGVVTNINESRLEIKVRNLQEKESIILLRGWESIETLRGQAFDFIVVDEIASMRNWLTNWNEVIRPTLTDTKGEVLFISTPKGFNHFYDLYNMQEKDSDYKSFHYTSYDNPHLPVDELDKAKKELPDNQFAQEYMADFRKSEGLVYKEFVRERHVVSELPPMNVVDKLVGVDFGYTNPCAIYEIRVDSDRNYWINKEYYKTGKTTEEIVEYAKSLGGNKYYPDPAEPDRIEEMRRAGLNIREVSKDIEAGILSVRELLKANRLKIHASCVHLIGEFETYHYPERKPDKNEPEIPVKEDDHALDAIRYVLYMQGVGSGKAHVHYASSAFPTNTHPPTVPGQEKRAFTYRPKL